MIDNKTVTQVIQSSASERIQFIEIILHSLKNDINKHQEHREYKSKKFKVRCFGLGEEVHVDRDELYDERL